MVSEFDIKDLYKSAFGGGYVRKPYVPTNTIARVKPNTARFGADAWKDVEVKLKEGFGSFSGSELPPGVRTSFLGTPIYMPVQLNGVWLPNEPLVEINGKYDWVREPMAGGKGTFKEGMGMDDWEITIRGVAVNEVDLDDYPEEEIAAIRELCELGEAISCQSPLFRIFGINQLVIEDFKFPAAEGMYSAQAYELKCYSDEDFELVLINENGG